jgi:hypothetical protein
MRRYLIIFGAMVLLLCGAIVGPVSTAQDDRNNQSPATKCGDQLWDNGIGHGAWTIALKPDDCRRLLSLWDEIGEDLKTEKSNLAGTYVNSGNSGYFLRWSTAKGFVVVPFFDQNLITDYGYGKVTFVDSSEVRFTPEKDLAGGRGLAKMPRNWTAILGQFAPVEMLADFGEYLAGLGEYNEFNGSCCEFTPAFLVDRVDRQQKYLPFSIPPKFQKFMKNPIAGTVISVGRRRRVHNWGYQGKLYSQWMKEALLTPVTIDVGRRQGVLHRMLFRLFGEPPFERYLEIRTVEARRARGYVVQDISNARAASFHYYSANQLDRLPRIRVGDKVATGPIGR